MEEPERKGCLARFVKSSLFDFLCAFAIVAHAVFNVHATDYELSHIGDQMPQSMLIFECLFLTFYIVEMCLQFLVHRLYFFCNDDMAWNIIDFVLIVCTCLDFALTLLLSNDDTINLTALRVVRLMKLVKVLRVVRVFRFLTGLRVLLDSILCSMVSLCWCLITVGIVFYAYGLMCCQGTLQHVMAEPVPAAELDALMSSFGSLDKAMLTLFQCTTGGEDWGFAYNLVATMGSWYAFGFILFIGFVQIALLNILTGVFIEKALKLAQPDRDEQALEVRKKQADDEAELKRVCLEIGGVDDGIVKVAEFAQHLSEGKLKAHFSVLGLDVKDAELFLKTLCHRNEFEVDVDSFVQGCMRLKGAATSIDIQCLTADVCRVSRRLEKLAQALVAKEGSTSPIATRPQTSGHVRTGITSPPIAA